MEIKYTDTFFKSLKVLNQTESPWHWKYYMSWFYDIQWFFKNIFQFLKLAKTYRPWNFDYPYYEYLTMHLKNILISLRGGMEINEDRIPKQRDIEKCLRILNRIQNDLYFDISKRIVGYEPNLSSFFKGYTDDESVESEKLNRKYYDKIREIEERDYNLLMDIIKEHSQSWWD